MQSSLGLARSGVRSAGMVLCGLLLWVVPANGQTFGVQAGVSVEPNQFYFGGHVETPPLADLVHFRPNIEIGLGDSVTLMGLNFEFVYRFQTQRPWELYAGGGPALNVIHTTGDTRSEGGFNFVGGVSHRDGLFAEVKVGALNSPNFKVGVGYVFR
jgi:hypothetical protein